MLALQWVRLRRLGLRVETGAISAPACCNRPPHRHLHAPPLQQPRLRAGGLPQSGGGALVPAAARHPAARDFGRGRRGLFGHQSWSASSVPEFTDYEKSVLSRAREAREDYRRAPADSRSLLKEEREIRANPGTHFGTHTETSSTTGSQATKSSKPKTSGAVGWKNGTSAARKGAAAEKERGAQIALKREQDAQFNSDQHKYFMAAHATRVLAMLPAYQGIWSFWEMNHNLGNTTTGPFGSLVLVYTGVAYALYPYVINSKTYERVLLAPVGRSSEKVGLRTFIDLGRLGAQRSGVFGHRKYGYPWDTKWPLSMPEMSYEQNKKDRERRGEREEEWTGKRPTSTWTETGAMFIGGTAGRWAFGSFIANLLKGIALRMAAVPGLKMLSGVIIMIAGLFNDPIPPDKTGTPDDLRKLPSSHVKAEKFIPIPAQWKSKPTASNPMIETVDITHSPLMHAIQNAILHNGHPRCKGKDGDSHIQGSKIVKLERIENAILWKAYWHKKQEMLDQYYAHGVRVQTLKPATKQMAHVVYDKHGNANPPRPPSKTGWMGNNPCDEVKHWHGGHQSLDKDELLDESLNEVFLYHGTKHDIVPLIAQNGFDERLASLDGLYGAGTYFAQESCKALQYAARATETWTDSVTGQPMKKTTKVILISRVVLGECYYATKGQAQFGTHKGRRRPPDKEGRGKGLLYDSMVANIDNGQMHREIMIYDRAQAYPEYIVHVEEGH